MKMRRLPWYLKEVKPPYQKPDGHWVMEFQFSWLGHLWFKYQMKRHPGGELHINITTEDGKNKKK